MQILNFIPEDYIQKKLVRKANLLCAFLVVSVLLGMAVLLAAIGMAEESLNGRHAEMDAKVAKAGTEVEKWKQFQSDRTELLEKADRAARLLVPLPRSRMLAEVVRALPEKASLTELLLKEDAIRVVESPAAQSATAKGRRGAAKTTTESKDVFETTVKLTGLAPTDVEVAQLIAALSNSSYFDQVELSFSQDLTVQDRRLRQFEVTFRLSDNAYRLALLPDGKEVRP